MPRLAGLLAALAFGLFAGSGAHAQGSSPIVIVIDQDRLFQESVLGQRISSQLDQRSTELAAENRTIETELIAEERQLTEQRTELSPEEFRALADAFDEKVERLRAEQDAKTRELVSIRDSGRQNFTQSVGPILLDYMRRTGASVMLDRRSVVATADRVDVTDELIAEIDARAGPEDPSGQTGVGEALAPGGGETAPEAPEPQAPPAEPIAPDEDD